MSYYAKVNLNATLALDSNYVSQVWNVNAATTPAYATTPVKEQNIRRTVSTSAENLDLSGLTTGASTDDAKLRFLAVINLDSTNYVTLSYGTVGDANNRAHRILAGGMHVCTDVDLTNVPTLTAHSAACDVQIIMLIASS